MRLPSLRQVAIALAVVFCGLQFFRPHKNVSDTAGGPKSFRAVMQVPPEVEHYLQSTCYDCHSDNTRYPWYTEIQPIAWMIAKHVRQGKQSLNFSEFGTMGARAQLKRINYMVDSINENSMPVASFTLLHSKTEESAKQATLQFLAKSIAALEARILAESQQEATLGQSHR